MPELTRTFTVAELVDIGVPFDQPDHQQVADEHVGFAGDAVETRRCLFRLDDRVWAVEYWKGIGDHCIDQWDKYIGGLVPATAMEERQVTVTLWMPVEAGEDA